MSNEINKVRNDVPQYYDNKVSKIDAEKLLDIINKNNSLWVIAVNAYNLGRHNATSA